MTLILHYHPLASFCHKVLIALYENATRFEARLVDFADEASNAELHVLWAVGKIPILRDDARDRTVPETSIIIEYLDSRHRGAVRLIPEEADGALEARLWDRFFDLYVHTPMQAVVADQLRPAEKRDALAVEQAKATLETAYALANTKLAQRTWAAGEAFSIADCAAAPALFYADTILPFAERHPHLGAYYERLLSRPSFARVLAEARPYFQFYPFKERLSKRFTG